MPTPYALFSTVQYPANSWMLSRDILTAAASGATSGQSVFAWLGVSLTTSRNRIAFQFNSGAGTGARCGIANTSDLVGSTTDVRNSVFIAQDSGINGNLYTAISNTFTVIYAFPALNANDWVVMEWSSDYAWFGTVNSGTFSGWNPFNPGANPDTNTGGIPISSYITASTPMVYGRIANPQMTVNTGGSAYPTTMGTTFSDLPATLFCNKPVVVEGLTSSVVWTGGAVTQLQYNLDGAGWVDCTGNFSGTGGTAFFELINDDLVHTVVFQDSGNPIDGTWSFDFVARPSGVLIFSDVVTIGDGNTGLLAFTAEAGTIKGNLNFKVASPDALFGVPCGIVIYDANSVPFAEINCDFGADGSFTGQFNDGNGGTPNASGTGTLLSASFVIGPLILEGDSLHGSLTFAWSSGETFTNSDYVFTSTGSTNALAAYLEFFVGGTRGTAEMSAVITMPPDPPETLSISTCTASTGDTASLTGAFANAPLEYASLAFDGGDFEPTANLVVVGTDSGTYSAGSMQTFSPGSHSAVIRDDLTGVESASFAFTVGSGAVSTGLKIWVGM